MQYQGLSVVTIGCAGVSALVVCWASQPCRCLLLWHLCSVQPVPPGPGSFSAQSTGCPRQGAGCLALSFPAGSGHWARTRRMGRCVTQQGLSPSALDSLGKTCHFSWFQYLLQKQGQQFTLLAARPRWAQLPWGMHLELPVYIFPGHLPRALLLPPSLLQCQRCRMPAPAPFGRTTDSAAPAPRLPCSWEHEHVHQQYVHMKRDCQERLKPQTVFIIRLFFSIYLSFFFPFSKSSQVLIWLELQILHVKREALE